MTIEISFPPPRRTEKLDDKKTVPVSSDMKTDLDELSKHTDLNELTRQFWARAIEQMRASQQIR